jgi:hypothetical protein
MVKFRVHQHFGWRSVAAAILDQSLVCVNTKRRNMLPWVHGCAGRARVIALRAKLGHFTKNYVESQFLVRFMFRYSVTLRRCLICFLLGPHLERAGPSSPGPTLGPGGAKKGPSTKAKLNRIGAMNPKSDKNNPDTNAIFGESDIDGAKILSVIDIKVRSVLVFC